MNGYYIFGGYLNGWTIAQSLQALGLNSVLIPSEAVREQAIPAGACLFFTEEASLEAWQRCGAFDYHFYPRSPIESILDKWCFATEAQKADCPPVPFCEVRYDPETVPFPLPWVLKVRRSWRHSQKLPRGWICRTPEEYRTRLQQAKSNGVEPELLFVQQYLPHLHHLSVAGFYDPTNPGRTFWIATRKVAGDREHLATGTLVITIPPIPSLGALTQRLLQHFEYEGVFEMEFLYDPHQKRAWVLEMNPRFWMQHGIFKDCYGNILTRTYIDPDFENPYPTSEESFLAYRPVVWSDMLFPLIGIRRGQWGGLARYVKTLLEAILQGRRPLAYPSVRQWLPFVRTYRRHRSGHLTSANPLPPP